ncbi:MAG: PEGA domain-containing protein, partial [Spirochaetota bacterium]
MNRKTVTCLAFLAAVSLFPCALSAQGKVKNEEKAPALPGVAVVNFTNNTGNSGLQHLSSSLPESVAGALAQITGIRLVERQNMGKVLNEVELQMSGMFDPDETVKIGKMAKADVLIIGSYAGSENNIILTIKAVEVATGKVIDGKVIQGSMSRIYDMASQASLSMAALIAGKNIGYISVSTNPDGCDIYLDGMLVGKSPVVSLKVAAGRHEVTAVKENYIEAETTLRVGVNATEKWMPTLPDKSLMNRTEWAIASYAFIPFSSDAQMGPLFAFSMGKTFERIYLGAELCGGWFYHSQDLSTAFGDVTHKRRFIPVKAGLHLNFIPFLTWRYFSPYGGIFAEGGRYANDHQLDGEWTEDEKNAASYAYNLGAAFGFNLLPYSKISLFVECRAYW